MLHRKKQIRQMKLVNDMCSAQLQHIDASYEHACWFLEEATSRY